LIKTTGYLVT